MPINTVMILYKVMIYRAVHAQHLPGTVGQAGHRGLWWRWPEVYFCYLACWVLWGRGRVQTGGVVGYCSIAKLKKCTRTYVAPKFCKINFCSNVYSVKYSYRNTNIILFDLFLLKRLHRAVHFNLWKSSYALHKHFKETGNVCITRPAISFN